jgi:hypothetical protein
VDIAAIVREVVARANGWGRGEGDDVEWIETGDDCASRRWRVDELKEVLLNVLENARLASAARVR